MDFPFMAIPAAVQSGFGLYQAIKGGRMLNNLQRPTYEIPQELFQNLGVAERLALEGLPAAQKQAYMQNMDRYAQMALQGYSDRRMGAGAVANVQSQMNQSSQQLLSMDAQQRLQNQQLAMSARERLAQARDMAFNLNQLQPYMDKRAEAQGLMGAGIQNVFGGMNQGFGMYQSQQNYNKYMDYLMK